MKDYLIEKLKERVDALEKQANELEKAVNTLYDVVKNNPQKYKQVKELKLIQLDAHKQIDLEV